MPIGLEMTSSELISNDVQGDLNFNSNTLQFHEKTK